METSDLTKLVEYSIQRLKAGEQVEVRKFELKRCLPELIVDGRPARKNISEFLKDLVALANTPGPTGYLVFGIDEKTGGVHQSYIHDLGLRDISDLRNLVVKHVDLPVDFEAEELALPSHGGKIVTVITVPPSLTKPHVIKNYVSPGGREFQNFVPVRKQGGIFPATRSDFEFMFYDRKNIEPDYALDIMSPEPRLIAQYDQGNHLTVVTVQLVVQNFGKKPLVIVASELTIDPNGNDWVPSPKFALASYLDPYDDRRWVKLSDQFIKIGNNDVKVLHLKYRVDSEASLTLQIHKKETVEFNVLMKDAIGNAFTSGSITSERHN